MNRRKLSMRTLMCLLACTTAACSSDLDQKEIPVSGEGERIAITATAGMPQDQPSTRLGFEENTGTNKLKLTWRPVGDSKGTETFSVLSGTGSTTPSTFTMQSIDASGATFTGEIIPADGTTYYAVYPALPAAASLDAGASATTIPLDMTGQTGDALDESKVYMYGSSRYTPGGTLNFGFQHLTSIVKATLKFPEALAGATASEVTFTATDGLNTNADADITAPSVTYSNKTTGSLALSGTFPISSNAKETTVYLHVLPDALTDFKVTSEVNGNSYTGTVATSATIDAGKMYTKTVEMEMKDPLADAKVGDFYCNGGDGKGYLIPGDDNLTEEQQKECIGIVYWVGSEAFNDDPLLKRDYPDCSHGLVVALEDAGDKSKWSTQVESVQNWVNNSDITYKDDVKLLTTDKMCGYSNTRALMEYNRQKSVDNEFRVLPCDAILDYTNQKPTPTNSSGWYLPSVMELKYVCWGQGKETQGATGRDFLNTQIDKVTGGTLFVSNNSYWSSTEGSYSMNAWNMYFHNGNAIEYYKNRNTYYVRLLLAF